tara:strand:+ start:2364 stop:2612 length:249 start_codon:yes stop_codon:yes gene_type:complete
MKTKNNKKTQESGWFAKILDGYTSIDYELEAEEKAYRIADEFAIKLFADSDVTVRQAHSVYVDVKKIIYKKLIDTYKLHGTK